MEHLSRRKVEKVVCRCVPSLQGTAVVKFSIVGSIPENRSGSHTGICQRLRCCPTAIMRMVQGLLDEPMCQGPLIFIQSPTWETCRAPGTGPPI